MLHPEVAFRSCEDCKLWNYDDTGNRVKSRTGEYQKRINKVPCDDPKSGCPKGHYSTFKPPTLGTRQAITLYKQAKATNGWCLPSRNRYDRLFAELCVWLNEVDEAEKRGSMLALLTAGGMKQ